MFTPGDTVRAQEAAYYRQQQEQAAAAERAKQDRIERWGRALSVLPAQELIECAQGFSSYAEMVKFAAQRGVDIQQEGR